MPNVELPVEEHQRRVKAIKTPRTWRQIAVELGLSADGIQRWAYLNGIKRPKYKESREKEVVKLLKQGKEYQEIADSLKIPHSTVRSIARRNNLTGKPSVSPKEVEEMLRLRKNGCPLLQIAKKTGRSAQTVYKYLSKNDPNYRKRQQVNPWTQKEVDILVEKWKEGLLYKDISKFLPNRNPVAVRSKISYLGLSRYKTKFSGISSQKQREMALSDLCGGEIRCQAKKSWDCCNRQKDLRFLQIDHINGDGYKDNLKGEKRHKAIIEDPEKYRKIYQVLCANANNIKKAENKEHGRSR